MPSLTDIEGVGPSLAAACVKNNYRTIAKIAAAKPSDLSVVPGISEKRAGLIIASARSLATRSSPPRTRKNKTRKAVAPIKVATASNSEKAKAKKKKRPASKVSKGETLKEEKMSDSKDEAKIKKLKKKIKKLKKEKKKIISKDSKKAKKKVEKKSGKKK